MLLILTSNVCLSFTQHTFITKTTSHVTPYPPAHTCQTNELSLSIGITGERPKSEASNIAITPPPDRCSRAGAVMEPVVCDSESPVYPHPSLKCGVWIVRRSQVKLMPQLGHLARQRCNVGELHVGLAQRSLELLMSVDQALEEVSTASSGHMRVHIHMPQRSKSNT